ncbi:hypothetical protein GCM10011529_13370 [Polymorphobacter glacialis]|uniref:Uncharacterized protein n=1 Tax=Sandarakinorhabdus glacialis TaxID=1614636 RepID=A0A916ZQU7_9SPHN|nr:hypothetical protein [Polymorphobacter glacialis]GGE08249.1 hypothetical protein GCM10011529_13370 [Polymorphobacter glacialis]
MALIGSMISALAGRTLAQTVGGATAGPVGAVIGLALPVVARRLGPLGMIGMAAGAWAISRALKDRADKAAFTTPLAQRSPTVTPPPIPMAVADYGP